MDPTAGTPKRKPTLWQRFKNRFRWENADPEIKRLTAEEDDMTDAELNMWALCGQGAYQHIDDEITREKLSKERPGDRAS